MDIGSVEAVIRMKDEMSAVLQTAAANVSTSAKTMSAALEGAGVTMKALGRTGGASAAELESKLGTAKASVADFTEAIKKWGEIPTLTQGLAGAKAEVASLETQLKTAKAEAGGLPPSLDAVARAQKEAAEAAAAHDAKLKSLTNEMRTIGRDFTQAGTALSLYVTAPLVGASAAAIKFGSDFETNALRLETLSGVSAASAKQMTQAILDMAPAVGVGPGALSEAMLQVTSTGLRGAEAIDVLRISAKASAVGLGETKTVAETVTSAMQAYGKENLSASEATNILYKTVVEGKGEVTSFAGAFGRVIGIASQVGVSFGEVGAYVATFTRLGVSAEEAVTALRGTLNALSLKEAPKSNEILQTVGLSVRALKEEIHEKGLSAALIDLMQRFHGNEEALAKVIPNIRALSGVMATAGSQAADYTEIQKHLTSGVDELTGAFARTTKTTGQQWKELTATLETMAVQLGSALLPKLKELLPALEGLANQMIGVVKWFGELNPSVQTAIIALVGVAAAAGPLLFTLGEMMRVGGATVDMWRLLEKAVSLAGLTMGASLIVLGEVAIAVAAVTAVVIAGYQAWNLYKESQERARYDAANAAVVQRELAEASRVAGRAVTDSAEAHRILAEKAAQLRSAVAGATTATGELKDGFTLIIPSLAAAHAGVQQLGKVSLPETTDALTRAKAELAGMSGEIREKALTALASHAVSLKALARESGVSETAIRLLKTEVTASAKEHRAVESAAKLHEKAITDLASAYWPITGAQQALIDSFVIHEGHHAKLIASEGEVARAVGVTTTQVKVYLEELQHSNAVLATHTLRVSQLNHIIPDLRDRYSEVRDVMAGVDSKTGDLISHNLSFNAVAIAQSNAIKDTGEKLHLTGAQIDDVVVKTKTWSAKAGEAGAVISDMLRGINSDFAQSATVIGGAFKVITDKGADTGTKLAAAFAAAATVIQQYAGHSIAAAVATGALSGAAAGVQFGPYGAAVGAAVGAIMGYIGASKAAREDADQAKAKLLELHGGWAGLTHDMELAGYTADRVRAELSNFGAESTVKFVNEMNAALRQWQKELQALQSVGVSLKGWTDQFAKDIAGLTATTAESQAQFDRLALYAVADFGLILQKTGDVTKAMEALGPTLDNLAKAQKAVGFEGSAAIAELLKFREVTEQNKELLQSVSALTGVMKGFTAAGVVSQELYKAFGEDVATLHTRLIASGVDGKQAILLMQPALQQLFELQKNYGFTLDETTQSLLDEAKAQGVVGETARPINEQMLGVLKEIKGVLDSLAASMGVFGTRAVTEADRISEGLDKVTKAQERNKGAIDAATRSAMNNGESWGIWAANTREILDTTTGEVYRVGGAVDDLARKVKTTNWKDAWGAFIDAADDAERAATAVAEGHSPGGIKQIISRAFELTDTLNTIDLTTWSNTLSARASSSAVAIHYLAGTSASNSGVRYLSDKLNKLNAVAGFVLPLLEDYAFDASAAIDEVSRSVLFLSDAIRAIPPFMPGTGAPGPIGPSPSPPIPGAGSDAGPFIQLPNGQWVPRDHPLAQLATPGAFSGGVMSWSNVAVKWAAEHTDASQGAEWLAASAEALRRGLVVAPMAAGGSGVVDQPTLFLAGEAGPEAFAFGSGAHPGFGDTRRLEDKLDQLLVMLPGEMARSVRDAIMFANGSGVR